MPLPIVTSNIRYPYTRGARGVDKFIVSDIYSGVRNRPTIGAEKDQIAVTKRGSGNNLANLKLFFNSARKLRSVEFLIHVSRKLAAIDSLLIW